MNTPGGILENTISFLYKVSETLPSDLAIPKSYYASKSRILELKGNCALSSKLTKAEVRCPRCCLNFSEYPPNIQLKSNGKQDRFTRKMLRKIEEGKPLTSFQEKFRRSLSKNSNKNALVNTCQFCKREIKRDVVFKINKSKKRLDDTPSIQQKKKKKRKDKFAGLTPSAIITLDDTKEETPVKKTAKQVLHDILKKKKDEEIKYNVVGRIDGKKRNKKRSKRLAQKEPVAPMKPKILGIKEKKAEKKKKDRIKNLLNEMNKPKASNILSDFLVSL